jgi:hypothetical protein
VRGFAGGLIFVGFVSALLHFTSIQLKIIIWAEPLQPVLGLVLGAIGCAILGIITAAEKRKRPAGPPPQGFGPPQAAGFAPGYPQQPPAYQQAPGFQQPQQFGRPPQPQHIQPQYPQPQYPPPQPYGPPRGFGPQR